jgi:hypothetical protein
MKFKPGCARLAAAGALSMALTLSLACAQPANAAAGTRSLWDHDNLVACVVNHFDSKARDGEQVAQMLNDLGITKYSYNWREADVAKFDDEIDAMQKHKVQLVAWVLYGSENPHFQLILDTFKRHHIHPQLWVEETQKGFETQPTADQQKDQVNREADRIAPLVKQAAPYGVKIILYNHNGWFGMEDNEIAVINRLKQRGVTNVGMVYNFTHARDKAHDDSKDFPALWARMKPHVVEVNITGMAMDDNAHVLYPSQGDGELDMLRTIQKSGWRGPIGITAEKGGNAEFTLTNYLLGLDWIAAELKHPGSGGPRPFPAP